MRKLILLVLAVTLVLSSVTLAADPRGPVRDHQLAPRTGFEPAPVLPAFVPSDLPGRSTLDDPISPRHKMGTTWYDMQSNGTLGREIVADTSGYIHVAWTNGLDSRIQNRHIYYNVWSPTDSVPQLPNRGPNAGGLQADGGTKAGFVTLAVSEGGYAIPAFHQTRTGSSVAHSAAGIDFLPHSGGFTVTEVQPYSGNPQILWPHVACNRDDLVFMFSKEQLAPGRTMYNRGYQYYSAPPPPIYGDSISWPVPSYEWASTYDITADVVASRRSNRVAVAWVDYRENWLGTNVKLQISEDRGINWGDTIRITDYPPIDTMCIINGGNVVDCNGDTNRPNIDVSLLFDQDDNVHVAFSTHAWFYWWPPDSSVGPFTYVGKPGQVWHWDEVHREYNIIADEWVLADAGTRQLMVHRPSLAIDTITQLLYCAYQRYDTNQWSEAVFPMADIWIAASTDNGRYWSTGTNVTNTDGGQGTPPPGSLSERDASLSMYVANDSLRLFYMMDHDAGTAIDTEGVYTLNEMYYQPVGVSQIPATPIRAARPLRNDSTGFPGLAVRDYSSRIPNNFALYQNYPNPFNPTTNIQFDLATNERVTLKVFDVLGREVATLMDHEQTPAGAHVISFDGSNLASGVYLYRIQSAHFSQTRKMVLMK